MKIVIITRGRVGKQYTLASIPQGWKNRTWLMCPPGEEHGHQCIYEPYPMDYSAKFQWVLDNMTGKVMIMDDDLIFSARVGDGPLTKATATDIDMGLQQAEDMLDTYPLVGFHPRAMGNNAPVGIKECTRINAVQGMNLDTMPGMRVDYWPILADMVLNIGLLEQGVKTAIWCQLFWDQKGTSNAPGGCSLHRTPEQQKEAVLGLAAMFPNVVTVKEKVVKNGWFGPNTPRTDFVVAWRKTKAARHG